MSILIVVLIVVAILAIGFLVPADSWSEARPEDVEALRVRLDEECRRGSQDEWKQAVIDNFAAIREWET